MLGGHGTLYQTQYWLVNEIVTVTITMSRNRSSEDVVVFLSTGLVDKCQGERFKVKEKGCDHQFAQLYFCRLHQLAPRVRDAAARKWPDVKGVHKLAFQLKTIDCQKTLLLSVLLHSCGL